MLPSSHRQHLADNGHFTGIYEPNLRPSAGQQTVSVDALDSMAFHVVRWHEWQASQRGHAAVEKLTLTLIRIPMLFLMLSHPCRPRPRRPWQSIVGVTLAIAYGVKQLLLLAEGRSDATG